jgi:hypothetical protein
MKQTREEVIEYAKKQVNWVLPKDFLPQEDYEEILYRQKGVCAICDKPETGNKRLAVDHQHGTKVIRGLLCSKCNTGIGLFNDSPGLLFSAIKYLQESKKLLKRRI